MGDICKRVTNTLQRAKKHTKEESGEERQRNEELNGKKKEKQEKEERFLRQKEEGKGREGKEHIS